MAYNCPECGQNNVPGTLFCEGCGVALELEAQRHDVAPKGTGGIGASAHADGNVAAATAVAAAELNGAGAAASQDDAVYAWAEATDSRGLMSAQPAVAGSGSLRSAPPTKGRAGEQKAAAVAEPAAADDVKSAPVVEEAPAAAAVAYLVSDTGRRVDVPTQDVAIVGREDVRSGIRPDVDLTLDGASAAGVSRRHCRLLREADGWYIEDLMSTNFTVLNGQALTPHVATRVQHGDQLRLGKLRLTFHEG